jgi:hypothetical protein
MSTPTVNVKRRKSLITSAVWSSARNQVPPWPEDLDRNGNRDGGSRPQALRLFGRFLFKPRTRMVKESDLCEI